METSGECCVQKRAFPRNASNWSLGTSNMASPLEVELGKTSFASAMESRNWLTAEDAAFFFVVATVAD
eukprot:11201123-Lingulodinium_polyedra.AAC.1